MKRKLGISYKILDSKLISFIAIISLLIGFFLIIESVNIRINTGETNEHWSRYIAMLFLSFFSLIVLMTKIVNYSLNLIINKKNYLINK